MARLFFIIFIIFLSVLPVSIAQGSTSQACIVICDQKYGIDGQYSSAASISDDLANGCGGKTTASYSEYDSCAKNVEQQFERNKLNCRSYLTNPCYGECQQNYDTCLSQSNADKGRNLKICLDTYIDVCHTSCTTSCDEERILGCVANACAYVKKSDAMSGDCSKKKEGDKCGVTVACVANTCQLVEDAPGFKTAQCTDRLIGDSCCSIKAGDSTTYMVEKRERVETRNWLGLTCTWDEYEWRSIAPYDPQTCTYNWDKKITKKVLANSGVASGFFEMLFCSNFGTGFSLESENPGSTTPKG